MRASEETASARFIKLPSWLLTQSAAHASRLVAGGLASLGASGYQYRVLATLDEFGPASQATLGRRAGVHLSDLVATINELANQRLVHRAPDPSDRRRNIVTITPAGRRHLGRLEKQLARIQDELLAPLAPDERDQLTRLLGRILHHHGGTTGPAAAEPPLPPQPAVKQQ